MGGIFGVVGQQSCVQTLFYGTDYHSHLGTEHGGMAVFGPKGFYNSVLDKNNSRTGLPKSDTCIGRKRC